MGTVPDEGGGVESSVSCSGEELAWTALRYAQIERSLIDRLIICEEGQKSDLNRVSQGGMALAINAS